MQINQCLHGAVLVSDLEKAEQFYTQILGLSKIERSLKYAGAWYQVGNFQIHLIVHPDYQRELTNTEKWGRNPHFAFAVDNLDEAKQRLETNAYPFQMSASGRAALFTQDPDGNIIEIAEMRSGD
ncbi:MAG: VOC family protein [Oscillatoria sp. PMC 1051.18]|nr:VOC family protein [Oscillatoria sp. PMC 1050.18]MEC5032826.1 VOC family protein [Oscillatoria sp. PMC 1051.18]